MIPEPAARQARGIIMVDVSLLLSRSDQFGTLNSLSQLDFLNYKSSPRLLSNNISEFSR
jgi:hypothetical protein